MGLGRIDANNDTEKFSMSILAAHLSQEINGVSRIHERVSRKIFSPMWSGYTQEEINIGHVTNGIHLPTWMAKEWKSLFTRSFETKNLSTFENWKKIEEIPEKNIWDIHLRLKKNLLKEIRNRIQKSHNKPHKNIQLLMQHLNALNEDALIIGFARRFVPYKRSFLLFSNIEKLSSIIKKSKTQILFLFAGKAHPHDYAGQDMMRQIIELSKQKAFTGHVLFLENYDIELARYLIRGVDVWLNLPEMELEASGTSGMKAAMNGVLNFSTLDGWWAEVFSPDAGWTLPTNPSNYDKEFQNELDSEAIYNILENEIIPLYEERNKENLPSKWIDKMRKSFEAVGPQFNANRMLNEYKNKYYSVLQKRGESLRSNNFEIARKIAAWKSAVMQEWNEIQVESIEIFDTSKKSFPVGSELNPVVTLNIRKLAGEDIGVEMIFVNKKNGDADFNNIFLIKELSLDESKDGKKIYSAQIPINQAGVYEYSFRIFAKNAMLPDRKDFPYIKWI